MSGQTMKIRCENCGAKYSIARNLLKKKVTKFRCKKCQHIMVVQGEDEIAAGSQSMDDMASASIDLNSQQHIDAHSGSYDDAGYGESTQHAGYDDGQAGYGDSYGDAGYSGGADYGSDGSGAYQSDMDEAMSEATQMTDVSAWREAQKAEQEEASALAEAASDALDDAFGEGGAFFDASVQEDPYTQAHHQEAQHSHSYEESAGYTESSHEDAWEDESTNIGASPLGSQHESDALDDEFDRALQEQEAEEYNRTAGAYAQNNIAPNHQEQGIVPLKQIRADDDDAQDDVSTKVFNINALEKLRKERKAAQEERLQAAREKLAARTGGSAKPSPAGAKDEDEWHAVIDGDQVGPFSFAQMKEKIRKGEIDGGTYIWKESFSADWRKIEDVPSFTAALSSVSGGKKKETPLTVPSPPKAPPAPPLTVPTNGGVASMTGSMAPISFAPAEEAAPPNDDLHSLAAHEASKFSASSSGPSSAAAQMLAEPEGGDSFAPPMTGGFSSFSGGGASFGSPSPAVFAGSPFEEEEKSGSKMGLILGVGGVVLLLLVGGLGYGIYALLESNKKLAEKNQNQPKVVTKIIKVQSPVLPTPAPQKVAAVGKAPAAKAPAAKAPPAKAAPAPTRRTRRRSRRRRRRTRRRRRRTRRRAVAARSRYVPPRSRSTAAAPPPPPSSGGGDLPPPPPGDGPPLPPVARKKATGLNSGELDGLLGGGGGGGARRRPPPRRALPKTLSRGAVMSVIRDNVGTIRACKESNGSGIDKAVVSWVIKRSGRASRIRVNPSSKPAFVSCVKRAISRWRFGKFRGSPIPIGGVPFRF